MRKVVGVHEFSSLRAPMGTAVRGQHPRLWIHVLHLKELEAGETCVMLIEFSVTNVVVHVSLKLGFDVFQHVLEDSKPDNYSGLFPHGLLITNRTVRAAANYVSTLLGLLHHFQCDGAGAVPRHKCTVNIEANHSPQILIG